MYIWILGKKFNSNICEPYSIIYLLYSILYKWTLFNVDTFQGIFKYWGKKWQ